MVCDSNIVIYAADPNDAHCLQYVADPNACIASITRIETLGFPRFHEIESDQRERLERLVASLPVLPLDEQTILRAIALRREKKIRLGDSIIAATALTKGMPLVTRNTADFKHIPDLILIDPFATRGQGVSE